jgi:hypothetical protein
MCIFKSSTFFQIFYFYEDHNTKNFALQFYMPIGYLKIEDILLCKNLQKFYNFTCL